MPLLAGTNDQTTRLAQTDTVGKIEKWRPEEPQTLRQQIVLYLVEWGGHAMCHVPSWPS